MYSLSVHRSNKMSVYQMDKWKTRACNQHIAFLTLDDFWELNTRGDHVPALLKPAPAQLCSFMTSKDSQFSLKWLKIREKPTSSVNVCQFPSTIRVQTCPLNFSDRGCKSRWQKSGIHFLARLNISAFIELPLVRGNSTTGSMMTHTFGHRPAAELRKGYSGIVCHLYLRLPIRPPPVAFPPGPGRRDLTSSAFRRFLARRRVSG